MQGADGFGVKSCHGGGRPAPGLPPPSPDTEFAA